MLCFEPLVYLNCLYIALLYAFFYLFFEAYPIIFEGRCTSTHKLRESMAHLTDYTGVYDFTKGQSGLALAPSKFLCHLSAIRAARQPWLLGY
jgi:hypothetical protein